MNKLIIVSIFILGYIFCGNTCNVIATQNVSIEICKSDALKNYEDLKKDLEKLNNDLKASNTITKNKQQLLDENNETLKKPNLSTDARIRTKNSSRSLKQALDLEEKNRTKIKSEQKTVNADLKKAFEKLSAAEKEKIAPDNNKLTGEADELQTGANDIDDATQNSRDESNGTGSFAPPETGTGGTNAGEGGNFLDQLFNSVNNWGGMSKDESLGNSLAEKLKQFIIDPIFLIGNLVIFIAAIILGLRYVWDGAEGKSTIKETMPNFVIGVMFFYLAQGITDLVFGVIGGMISGNNSFQGVSDNIFSTVGFIVNIAATIGFIIIGIKYMFASASEKAEMKQTLLTVVIGLILIYCVNNVIQFIFNVGSALV